MSLRERLAAQIAAGGPLTLAQYMTACLHDPQEGYYATRPAIGEAGDFITAPSVSQMFGELVGLWAAQTWLALGSPPRFRLAEAGPGDGTLMQDVLRAAGAVPGFREAADLWLIEASPPLRARQAERLAEAAPSWAERLDDVPGEAPLILLANEFLDCLPARQFVRTEQGWREKMVGVDAQGRLAFGISAPLPPPFAETDGPIGSIREVSAAQEAFGLTVGARLAADGGAALLIDYGSATPGGDTFQALKRHEKVDPLASPGEADLTVHADFAAVAAAAVAEGAAAAPLLTQAQFLGRMGIEARAQALAARRPDHIEVLSRQFDRLTAQNEMGELFKVLCLHAKDLSPPAFEEAR